jgi:hypothetical protein
MPIVNGNSKTYDESINENNLISTNSTCQTNTNDNNKPKSLKPLSKQSLMRRKSLTTTKHVISTKDIRTAFMLFVVSFLFLVFYLPSIAYTYLVLFQEQNQNTSTQYNPPLYILYLYFSNSAINPIIYCFLNPTFRADLVKLFFKRGFMFNKCVNNVNLK